MVVSMIGRPSVAIPEKLFFKIGEVCELAGVQAHVLRYWESEFPMLAPQKNRAGQRVYRKRDVEIALRIKELLYEDQYTIAGAKKRLANDMRAGGKLRVVSADDDSEDSEASSSMTAATGVVSSSTSSHSTSVNQTAEDRKSLRKVAAELREILALLEAPKKRR
ncbi:MAG TPA: MerR family transcriptional regulator [Pyrinomonadaceae bacterium]